MALSRRLTAAALTLIAVASTGFGQATSKTGCLSYEPVVVTISGTLVRRTFPGPPNYQSVQHGDRAETYLLLDLPRPVCVATDTAEPDLNAAQSDIRRIQLLLKPELYERYKAVVGQSVIATGTLVAGITGHHHTPVLLNVTEISKGTR